MSGAPATGLARRLASNTLHAAIGRAIALIVWLALAPVVFHGLTREQFGVWSLFFALTGYLGSLDLGLAQSTLRASAAAHARGDLREAGEHAALAALGYAALAIVWLAITPFVSEALLGFLRLPEAVRPGARLALGLGPVVFGLVGLTNTALAVMQGVGRFDLANVVNLASAFGQAGGILTALRLGHGLEGVLVATTAGWALAFVAGLFVLPAAAPGFAWAGPARAWTRLGETLRFGGPMQLANAVAVFHQQVDKLLLSRAGALAAVGPYELGLRVSTAAALAPYLMMQVTIPEAARLHALGEPARLRELYERTNRYVLAANAVMTAALLASADRLFAAWLGGEQSAGALALRGLALAVAAALVTGTASSTTRAMGRTDLDAEYSVAALVVHLGLAAWLVPRYMLPGALASLVAGNVAGGAWFLWRFGGVVGWPRLPLLATPLGVPLIAAALGAAAGWAVHRALPEAVGIAAWGALALVAAVAALATAAIVLAVRFVPPREVAGLFASLARPRDGIDGRNGAS